MPYSRVCLMRMLYRSDIGQGYRRITPRFIKHQMMTCIVSNLGKFYSSSRPYCLSTPSLPSLP